MKEALKLALEALEYWDVQGGLHQPTEEAITAIKAALAQPAQPAQREPLIAFRHGCKWCGELNGCEHKQPPQRTWVDLKPEDRLCAKYMLDAPEGIEAVIDYITAKLKELNT